MLSSLLPVLGLFSGKQAQNAILFFFSAFSKPFLCQNFLKVSNYLNKQERCFILCHRFGPVFQKTGLKRLSA